MPESPVSVEFIVHAPVPCPEYKTITGNQMGSVKGWATSVRRRRAPRFKDDTELLSPSRRLARVPVLAELVTALGLDQAWEAPGQAPVWGWAERPVRQRLIQVLVT